MKTKQNKINRLDLAIVTFKTGDKVFHFCVIKKQLKESNKSLVYFTIVHEGFIIPVVKETLVHITPELAEE